MAEKEKEKEKAKEKAEKEYTRPPLVIRPNNVREYRILEQRKLMLKTGVKPKIGYFARKVGVSDSHWGNVESMKVNPSENLMHKMVEALGMDDNLDNFKKVFPIENLDFEAIEKRDAEISAEKHKKLREAKEPNSTKSRSKNTK